MDESEGRLSPQKGETSDFLTGTLPERYPLTRAAYNLVSLLVIRVVRDDNWRKTMNYTYERNQKVAFLGGNTWHEGTYLRAIGDIHVVKFPTLVGPLEYKVPPLHVKPLEVAIEEGVEIEAPVAEAA